MQTQTSNTLHSATIEAGSKDHPPMLAPGWKDKEVLTSEGSLVTRTERVNETYKNVSQDIRDQLNAEAKDGESLESYYSRFYKMMNELIRNQCKVTNHQVNVQGKANVNSPQPIYDQEPSMVAEDDETSKDKEINKLMALISLSFKKIYKPTNNNLRTSSNTSRANQDNSPRINRNAGYENQRNGTVSGARENVEQVDWRDDTDDDELEDQELEAHYMYICMFYSNRSLLIPRHEKTPYHIINDRKPSVKFFHIFGSTCYIVRDGENLDKMKEKDQISSDPAPECQTMALNHDSLSPTIQCQTNVPQADRTVSTSNELDLLFSLMFDELLNGSCKVVSKSYAISAADAPN
nr:hypothetical protein [Tanacetum cinerariifolium]